MNQPIPEPIFPSSKKKKKRFLHALLWNPPNTFFYLDKNSQCKPSHLASLIIKGYSEPPNTTATCLEIRKAFVCHYLYGTTCQLGTWHPVFRISHCLLTSGRTPYIGDLHVTRPVPVQDSTNADIHNFFMLGSNPAPSTWIVPWAPDFFTRGGYIPIQKTRGASW